ncbi:MAG: diaminopimelate decarboxylase [Bdellovibrionales bacterium RIFOXYD1_FULL_53_11]|nr:MAG: diaminopimelate decarboxylase [Bdellovibrionales bacterium RIFOXYD1_FULL_53_11]
MGFWLPEGGAARWRGGHLYVGEKQAVALVRAQGTPLYAYSARTIRQKYAGYLRAFSGCDALVAFAVKACPNAGVLRTLARLGAGMDVVSGGELGRALAVGVPGERIVYSGVGKMREEIKEALRAGILAFNVESEGELELIAELSGKLHRAARVSFRLNPGVDAGTLKGITTGRHADKFGLTAREVLRLAGRICRMHRNMKLTGLSMHIGSQLTRLAPLGRSLGCLRETAARIYKEHGLMLDFLDAGGGLGVAYRFGERVPSVEDYARTVLQELGPGRAPYPVRIIVEPGRSIAADAGVLLATVLYIKTRGARRFLILDAGMNDLMRPALYGAHHEIVPAHTGRRERMQKFDVVGPLCESTDTFAAGRLLPASLKPGDVVAILSAGAYGASMAGTYNSRQLPREIVI